MGLCGLDFGLLQKLSEVLLIAFPELCQNSCLGN